MAQEMHRVRVVVTVTEPQSPHIQINFETGRELDSNLTTIELLTCVEDAITKLIKEKDSARKKSVNYGRLPIDQLWDIYLSPQSLSEEKHSALNEIRRHSSFRR